MAAVAVIAGSVLGWIAAGVSLLVGSTFLGSLLVYLVASFTSAALILVAMRWRRSD